MMVMMYAVMKTLLNKYADDRTVLDVATRPLSMTAPPLASVVVAGGYFSIIISRRMSLWPS